MTLQWSLAAAALCAAWRRGAGAKAAMATRAVAAIPLLTLASIAALLLADHVLVWPERLLMLALAALTAGLWSFGFIKGEEAPGLVVRLLHSRSPIASLWLGLSALLHGAFTLTSTWIVLFGFLEGKAYMLGVWRWLWLALLGALAIGALLLAVTLAGVLAEPEPADDDAPERAGGATARLALAMIALAGLRALVLAGSVALWIHGCPFGPRYMAERMLIDGYNLIALRILLGLILPVLFGLLALLTWRGDTRQQAVIQFLPAFILVLISEMTACALTVGFGGMVF